MIKILNYLKPFSLIVAIIIGLVFVQALADLYLPTLLADIVDVGIVNGDTDYILRIGGFMLLVTAGSAACSILPRSCRREPRPVSGGTCAARSSHR